MQRGFGTKGDSLLLLAAPFAPALLLLLSALKRNTVIKGLHERGPCCVWHKSSWHLHHIKIPAQKCDIQAQYTTYSVS